MNSLSEHTKALYFSIFQLLLKKGLKGLTMDSIAAQLGISKRTLYEIFVNKTDMVVKIISYMFQLRRDMSEKIFTIAENSLLGAIQIFYIHRYFLCKINGIFFQDMDRYFPAIKKFYEEESQKDVYNIHRQFKRGIDEGFFREDADYLMQLRVFHLQLEALKRIENHFPTDISLENAYDIVYASLLYSLVTEKGKQWLQENKNNKKIILNDIEKYLYKNDEGN